MYTSTSSRYTTLPRTSSYSSSSRYSTVSSSLPPVSTRYTPSKYSSYLTSSVSLPRHSTISSSRYSSSYSKPLETSSWRSAITSPSLTRKSSSSSVSSSRRPSFSGSDLGYRSGSVSSLSSSSADKPTSSYASTTATSGKDVWVPLTRRLSSMTTSAEPSSTEASSSYTPSYRSSVSRSDRTKLAGRVGLHNLGNTCFMNAVLQCLCHTKPLVEYCTRGSFSADLNHRSPTGGDLIKAFASLTNVMWKDGMNDVSPDHLKRELQKYAPRFSGYNQQDAQELLRYLLQGLHEDINRVVPKTQYRSYAAEYLSESQNAAESWRRYKHTDDSKIVDLFCGQLKSTLTCTECGHISVTFDPFWDLSLPIPEGSTRVTIQQCLRLFSSVETLDGPEQPICEKCKRRTRSTKQLMIHRSPVILVVHLKRFSSGLNYRNKLNVTVECNQRNLDLSEFATSSCSSSSLIYNLYGVVDHYGSVSSGHYTAKCKNPYSEEWNEFNDSMVTSSVSDLVTDKAYLLFYEQARQGWSSRL